MTVIDLGELRDDAPAPGPSARPPRAVGRPFRGAVVLLVALVTLAAAAPSARPAPRRIPGGTGATAFLSGDRVYVALRATQRPGWDVVAYREGRERWRAGMPGTGDVVGLWQQGGRVLAVGTGEGEGWETVAFDAGTGALRWRQSGLAFPAGDALLLRPVGGPRPQPVRRLAVADGRTLWTAPAPDGQDVQFSYGPSGVERILLVPNAGRTVVLDAVTGARLAVRNLHPEELPGPRTMQGTGGLFLETVQTSDAGATVNAYELDTLRLRWTVELPLVDHLEQCGGLLCAARQNGGIHALDPATGALRWTAERWQSVLRADAGRLLVATGGTTGDHLAVLDGADGRLVADLGDWAVLPQDELTGRILLTRPLGGGRQLLAEPDLSGGPPVVRDVLTGTDCRAGTTLLVCRQVGGDFTLRRLR
ncbi:PQQ-binding-like beta-propeller repeat protein [Micromonospora sp. WMMC241]|uniref:outer membrane protein assembly factor BamB family protein n=1 Tax=Micromonospora sp. WMMC241 TaxID=3015159 RepID=UPI0022B71520|nr:PQQ-binding-like beta-propeller repeat protein [Micromonospora sp. WMMC241]MCZ7438983.1 PQQ-binding-like beta-propeller repeat protein [Micromonospora sp. WMMC241]